MKLPKLAAFANPSWLLAALLLTLPFERIPSFTLAGVSVRLCLFIGLVLIAVVVIKRQRAFFKLDPLFWWLLAFLGLSLISALTSRHVERAVVVVGFEAFVMVLAWSISLAVEPTDLPKLRKWLLVGAGLVSALAIYQFLGDLFGLSYRLTGLRPDYTRAAFGFPRPQGASLEPLFFANYLLLPLSIIGAYLVFLAVPFWLPILIYVCLFLTVSRGGIAGALLVTGGLTLAGLIRRRIKATGKLLGALLLGGTMAYLLISFVVPWVGRLHQKPGTPSYNRSTTASQTYRKQATNYEVGDNRTDRSVTRSIALHLFLGQPLLGVGPGNFGYYAHDQRADFSVRQTVNNLPLEILAETGLLGGLALAGFAIGLLRQGLRSVRRASNRDVRLWCLALVLFLVATLVQYQTFSTLYIIHIWVAVGLLLGLSRANEAKVLPKNR